MTPDHTALPESGVVTIHEVSRYFGVCKRTAEKWVAKGQLKKLNLDTARALFDVNEVRKLGSK